MFENFRSVVEMDDLFGAEEKSLPPSADPFGSISSHDHFPHSVLSSTNESLTQNSQLPSSAAVNFVTSTQIPHDEQQFKPQMSVIAPSSVSGKSFRVFDKGFELDRSNFLHDYIYCSQETKLNVYRSWSTPF